MTRYQVHYMRPEYFRDGIFGASHLREVGKMPDPKNLSKTHIFLRSVAANDLEELFCYMQGDVWSPNGEARSLIESKGLKHTSMSVGDIAIDQDTGKIYLVDTMGFEELGNADKIR